MLSLLALHPPCAPGLIFHHGGATSLLRASDQCIGEILVDYIYLLLNSISKRLSHRIVALILAFSPFLDWISLNLSLPLYSSILFL
jgi:hypothetical protein